MLERRRGYLVPRESEAPKASRALEVDGCGVIENVMSAAELAPLRREIEAVYRETRPDSRGAAYSSPEVDEEFRYEMLNRSALCQQAVAHPGILSVIEPLLGEDCHVIANTAWRNPPQRADGHAGGFWHIDAGPHIPRTAEQVWPADWPYPIFAIGVHILLQDCPLACGPTGVIPGSHRSGQVPPAEHRDDVQLTWDGRSARPLVGKAGDVTMFVSDAWHRRLPAGDGDQGRFFLQVHYARRDIAQRLWTSDRANQLSEAARGRADSDRARTLVGLHAPRFYDG